MTSGRLLLDTHTAIWLLRKPARIGRKAMQLIDHTLAMGEVYISAISWWECGLLVDKGKKMQIPADYLHRDATELGITTLALTAEMAMLAAQLGGLHADPADRFICATAMLHNATLITADSKILDWQNHLKRWNATV